MLKFKISIFHIKLKKQKKNTHNHIICGLSAVVKKASLDTIGCTFPCSCGIELGAEYSYGGGVAITN